MPDRPPPPPDDALYLKIRAMAARIDREALRVDLEDPALIAIVDRAVAPFEDALTTEGLVRARDLATFAVATSPHRVTLLEKQRARMAQGSGVQPKRDAGRLLEVARRRQGSGGR
jgi:hypothetical protein